MENENKELPEMAGEQAAELAALESMAREQVTPQQAAEEEAKENAPKLADEISAMLSMVVKIAAPIFPSLKAIYTEEVIESVGVSVAPVCEKHEWLQDGIAGKYGEEIMAMFVVGPLCVATYIGIGKDIENNKQRKPEQLQAATASANIEQSRKDSESPVVTMGEVRPHENK